MDSSSGLYSQLTRADCRAKEEWPIMILFHNTNAPSKNAGFLFMLFLCQTYKSCDSFYVSY
jgi:hypothetical protein